MKPDFEVYGFIRKLIQSWSWGSQIRVIFFFKKKFLAQINKAYETSEYFW